MLPCVVATGSTSPQLPFHAQPHSRDPRPPFSPSDWVDSQYGTLEGLCDYNGADLVKNYGCDCTGCQCAATAPPTPSDAATCYTLKMYDSAANGWGGAMWKWRAQGADAGSDGQLLKTGTLSDGASGTDTLCTYASISCYLLEVTYGSEGSTQISWEIAAEDGGDALWAGGAEPHLSTTVSTCTADPTLTPVPTATTHPTGARVETRNDEQLREAVETAGSGRTIVMTGDITLADTLEFPVGLTDVTLRADTPGTALKGTGGFSLINVKGTELTLENLLLTGGNGGSSDAGGALYAAQGAIVHARQCGFSQNVAVAGGAVHLWDSTGTFDECLFELNEATDGPGGAAILYGNSHGTFSRSIFAGNTASGTGGALCFDDNRPDEGVEPSQIDSCEFNGNTATDGGAIDVEEEHTTLLIRTTSFDFNVASGSGGALSASDTAIVTVEDSAMTNNAAAESGGGAFANDATITFTNVTLADCSAGLAGGGVAAVGESVGVFKSSSWTRCGATRFGGGLAAWNNVRWLECGRGWA